jgi:FHS family L-fucose permease-like MFS transporter
MFPTIFTLTLERSDASTEVTSGFLCLSIVGGALIPLVTAALADHAGYRASFFVPAACYAFLCAFAVIVDHKQSLRSTVGSSGASGH